MNLFQIMANDGCSGIGPIVTIIKHGVFPIIQIGIPILLILFGSLDLGKAVISNDDKEIKGATTKLIKRALIALAVFFIVIFVKLVFGWLGKTNTTDIPGSGKDVEAQDWWTCWDNS